MKKTLLIPIFLITGPTFARICDISPYADLEKVVEVSFENQKACLKSMAFAPTTPPYPKSYFQKISGEEIFVINCNLGEEDYNKFDRYLFLTQSGIKSLKYPKYFYRVGIDTAELPRNVVHFKDGATDYYMVPDIVGQPTVHTADKLPQISQEIGTSLNKIRSEYIKKYEDHLRTSGELSAINLGLADKDEAEAIMPCLEKKQKDIVSDYMGAKFRGIVPAYGTMVNDHNQFQNLPAEARLKYQRPWTELKEMIVKDLLEANPACQGVIDEKEIDAAFEKNWSENQKIYEGIRKRFNP